MNDKVQKAKENTKAIDADFEVVDESSNLPSLPFVLWRHRNMSSVETEQSKQAKDELELDKELRLENQAKMTAAEVLSDDINKLSEKHGYPFITGEKIRQLFEVDKLTKQVERSNVTTTIISHFINISGPIILSVVLYIFAILLLSLMIYTFNIGTLLLTIMGFSVAICYHLWVAEKYTMNKVKHNKRKLENINCFTDLVKSTSVRIPRKAKEKMLEAHKLGIFEDFSIVHVSKNQKTVDPAILGITQDGRTMLICWWVTQEEPTTQNMADYNSLKIEV